MKQVVLRLLLCVIVTEGVISSQCRNWPLIGDTLLSCAKKSGAGQFATAVKNAGLENEFDSKNHKSLFAPSDAAFAAVPQHVRDLWKNNTKLLQATLRYHLTDLMYEHTDFMNNMLLATHVPGANERVNIYAPTGSPIITVNGFPIIANPTADLKEGNVFILSGCLYRIPALTIFDYIATNDSLSILLMTVAKTSLENMLQGKELTMFAPTNGAFDKLPDGVLFNLLNNLPKLADVLLGHVVKDVFYSPGLPNHKVLTTMSGRNVTITTAPGSFKVNNATVVDPDVPAGNGVLHTIDTVLLP